MQSSVYNYLNQNPELLHFVRLNPIWYRYLSRNPYQLQELEKAAKEFYGKTLPQRIDRIGDQIQKASMLFQLADALRED